MKEIFEKIYINSESDLPKAGLYFCAITDDCYGSFHFNPDDKDDIDFWIGNVMWYLITSSGTELIVPSEEDVMIYFNNHFNCYAESDTVIPAMTRGMILEFYKWAIEQIKKLNK